MAKYMFDIPQYDGIGIYALVDDAGKMYIGSSINIKRRLAEHSKGLVNGNDCKSLIDAVRQGRQFKCEILEKIPYGCNTYHLRKREHFYISKHDTIKNGYNTAFPTCAVPQDIESSPIHKGNAIARAIHDKYSKPILKPTKKAKPIKQKGLLFRLQLQGEKQRYKDAAASAGVSMAQFFIDAAEDKIQRENLL